MLDVLIVGAGPSGLMMASMLIKHNISCRIIEKKAHQTKLSKALGVHARTLEIFEKMGLVESFLERGNPTYSVTLYFEGQSLLNLTLDSIQSDYKEVLVIPQSETERLLKDFIEKKGCRVEYDKELIDFKDTDGLVQASVHNHDGSFEEIRAKYLIACDGAHSLCRQKSNIDFIDKKYTSLWALCDVKIKWPYSYKELQVFMSNNGILAVFCMKNDCVRLVTEVNESEREEVMKNLTLDYFKKVISKRAKAYDWELSSPGWMSHFEIHHRIAEKLRLGRVFLLGDAAHIHSPVGGQGMNTGIQDAYNLSWKLAEVLKGHAPISLLESYSNERGKVIKEIVSMTHAQTIALGLKSALFMFFKKKLLPFMMSFHFMRVKITNLLSQVSRNYKGSSIVKDDWPLFKISYLKAGERFPNFIIKKNNKSLKLSSVLDDTSHHVLFFLDSKKVFLFNEMLKKYSETLKSYLPKIKSHFFSSSTKDVNNQALSFISQAQYKSLGVKKSAIFLIRPDGYIGFSSGYSDLRRLVSFLEKTYFRKMEA